MLGFAAVVLRANLNVALHEYVHLNLGVVAEVNRERERKKEKKKRREREHGKNKRKSHTTNLVCYKGSTGHELQTNAELTSSVKKNAGFEIDRAQGER